MQDIIVGILIWFLTIFIFIGFQYVNIEINQKIEHLK
jgi:hypothetical protein